MRQRPALTWLQPTGKNGLLEAVQPDMCNWLDLGLSHRNQCTEHDCLPLSPTATLSLLVGLSLFIVVLRIIVTG